MKKKRKILRIVLMALGIPVVAFLAFLGVMTFMDYRPDAVETVQIKGMGTRPVVSDTLSLVSWNIGYCGLGKDQDFFFDGGSNVRPKLEEYKTYQAGVLEQVKQFGDADFILLQEVDITARRSYRNDQVALIAGALPDFCHGFSLNYKTLFVPQPLTEPYGKVFAGIATFANVMPKTANRHRLSPDAGWPVGLFMLKRCFMDFHYPLPNGKELVVVNLHLSAYDDGTVKQEQMDDLKTFLLEEYKKGNYVLAGGDWNQLAPGYVPEEKGKLGIAKINAPDNYPETGWQWAHDNTVSTNRSLEKPYDRETSQTLVIDYFLLSPNIQLQEVQGIDLDFQYSDHNPVRISVVLN